MLLVLFERPGETEDVIQVSEPEVEAELSANWM
jgi:hypothetical protein